jgi:hypothetical protein
MARDAMLDWFLREAKILGEQSKQLWDHASVPAHCKANSGHINVLLFKAVAHRWGYGDKNLWRDIVMGFPLTGPTPDTGGVFKKKDERGDPHDYIEHPDLKSRFRFDAHRPAPRWMAPHLITKAESDFEGDDRFSEISENDARWHVEKRGGFVNYCHTIDQSEPGKEKLRTVVHYDLPNKLSRLEDHIDLPTHAQVMSHCAFSMSGGATDISGHVLTKKQIAHTNDRVAKKDALFVGKKKRAPARKFSPTETLLLIDDYSGAYYQLSCRDPSKNILGVWSEEKGAWRYYQSSTMNFGSVHSVHAWMRTAKAVQYVLRTYFRIPVLLYVDDMICIQPAACAPGAKAIIKKVVDAFGLRLAKDKSKIGQQVDILGASYDTRDCEKLRVDLKPSKKEKLKRRLADCVKDASAGALQKKRFRKNLRQRELPHLRDALWGA